MYVKSLLLAAGLLAVTGCANNMTVPAIGLDHPANPQAATAPPLPPLTIPEARESTGARMQGMQGMNHGSMDSTNMAEGAMKGMDHGAMQGMDLSSKRKLRGMDHDSMKGMKNMKGTSGKEETMDMERLEGGHHAYR